MPLDGSGNYYYPLGTPGVPNQTIESEKYNTFLDDLRDNDLNVARPVSRGGTGASTPEQARINLGVMPSTGGPMTGSIIVTGTITASTGLSAGIIYLGTDGTHYLQWNGTTYSLPSGPLAIGGNTTITGGLGATGNIGTEGYLIVGGTSNTGIVRFGHATNNYLYFDGTSYALAGGLLNVIGLSSSGAVNGASLSSTGNASVGLNLVVSGTINSGAITATSLTAAGNISGAAITGTSLSLGSGAITCGSINGGTPYTTANPQPVATNYMLNTGGTYTGDLTMNGNLKTATSATVGNIFFGNGGHALNYNSSHSDGWTFFGGGGGFWIGTGGYKPGGGDWADSSDARIKTVLGEYASGLDQIKQLRPQRYKFKGNDEDHQLVTEQEFIGLIAQDVEGVMPEMVTQKTGKIDGVEVQDLRMLDASALIYALVNSVRELATRVEELEAA